MGTCYRGCSRRARLERGHESQQDGERRPAVNPCMHRAGMFAADPRAAWPLRAASQALDPPKKHP